MALWDMWPIKLVFNTVFSTGRKGPAVRGPRMQADRKLYRQAMQRAIEEQGHLDVVEGEVDDITVDANGHVDALCSVTELKLSPNMLY